MCTQVVERYTVCRCLYCKHAIAFCAAHRQGSCHMMQERTVLVGYACKEHSSYLPDALHDAKRPTAEMPSESRNLDEGELQHRLQSAESRSMKSGEVASEGLSKQPQRRTRLAREGTDIAEVVGLSASDAVQTDAEMEGSHPNSVERLVETTNPKMRHKAVHTKTQRTARKSTKPFELETLLAEHRSLNRNEQSGASSLKPYTPKRSFVQGRQQDVVRRRATQESKSSELITSPNNDRDISVHRMEDPPQDLDVRFEISPLEEEEQILNDQARRGVRRYQRLDPQREVVRVDYDRKGRLALTRMARSPSLQAAEVLPERDGLRATQQRSCVPCRRRKSKCDGAMPACSTCTAVYKTECTYDPYPEHRNADEQSNRSTDGVSHSRDVENGNLSASDMLHPKEKIHPLSGTVKNLQSTFGIDKKEEIEHWRASQADQFATDTAQATAGPTDSDGGMEKEGQNLISNGSTAQQPQSGIDEVYKVKSHPRGLEFQDTLPERTDSKEVKRRLRVDSEAILKGTTWNTWCDELAEVIDNILTKRDVILAKQQAVGILLDACLLLFDDISISVGLLEPPLAPEWKRLRWQNGYGEHLFSDVLGLKEGGLTSLITRMQDLMEVEVVPTSYNQQAGNQKYIRPRPLQWFRRAANTLLDIASKVPRRSSPLPLDSTSIPSSTLSQGTVTQVPLLHLMACLHDKRSGKVLQQDHIGHITNDRMLFDFLRDQYRRRRSRFRTALSLKCVQGIYFVNFQLPMGDSVIVRQHWEACAASIPGSITINANNPPISNPCACLPPRIKVEPKNTAEYDCNASLSSIYPPIPPEFLLQFFTGERAPPELSRWIVGQLPKRKWGELWGRPNQPAEGWGIYYKEGWDRDMIALFGFMLLSASLVFGTLWTTMRGDIQGAFGVASWMVAMGGAVMAVIVTQADSV